MSSHFLYYQRQSAWISLQISLRTLTFYNLTQLFCSGRNHYRTSQSTHHELLTRCKVTWALRCTFLSTCGRNLRLCYSLHRLSNNCPSTSTHDGFGYTLSHNLLRTNSLCYRRARFCHKYLATTYSHRLFHRRLQSRTNWNTNNLQ